MGLDITHDCWHGAYSAFMAWRRKLAEVAELPPLDLMEGFYPGTMDILRDVDPPVRDRWEKSLPIKWASLRRDVLYVLLYHSDYDGDISPELCGPLADRLEELIPLLPDEIVSGHIGHWRVKTQKFVDGLRLAASRGEAIEFFRHICH
jgi:hypothetical protein